MSEDTQTTNLIKVLIVDDQQIIREGISTILSFQPGLEVAGTAANGQEAIEQALSLRPDVILMDIRMPGLDGVAATARLRQELPSARILMLTTFDDEEYVLKALQAGASGYLLKDIPGSELAQAVRAVHGGVYQLDPTVAARLVGSLTATGQSKPAPTASGKKPDLSEREVEILRLVATGATNREIGERLFITEGTVKNHVSNILIRLNLRDRTQAALYARENGFI